MWNRGLSGLGAALEQQTVGGWKPISFDSRLLYYNEERDSITELENLGVNCPIKC